MVLKRLIIRGYIRVPCHADIIFIRHLVLVKHKLQVLHDHLFHADITDVMSREIQDIRYVLRDRHDPCHIMPVHFQIRHHIDFLVQKMRKRMVRVYDLGRKHRKDLFLKIFFYILFFLLLQVPDIQSAHTVWLELFLDLRIGLIPLFIQRGHCPVDRIQLLLRGHAGPYVQLFIIHSSHIIQAAHPDHKKLVQIARKYGDKLHPFHKGDTLVPCLFQHSLVKSEPRQLPVLRVIKYLRLCHTAVSSPFFFPLLSPARFASRSHPAASSLPLSGLISPDIPSDRRIFSPYNGTHVRKRHRVFLCFFPALTPA